MKKRVLAIVLMMVLSMSLMACGNEKEYLESEIIELETEVSELETEIAQLKSQRDTLKSEIIDIKVDNGTAKYIITFNIKQTHFSLDLSQHLKDDMNDISIQIPVDKEYYDSVNVGDVIDDSFRLGSLIMKGSFGSWKVTVENKEVK